MTGISSARVLAIAGTVLAVGGTVVSAIDARQLLGVRDASFITAVGGLLLLAIVIVIAGERAMPQSLLVRHRRFVPWLAPALAVFVMATMLVSRYGFRDCDDLAAPHRCSCYYVAWERSARSNDASNIQAQWRAAVRAACPQDEIPPELNN